MDPTNNDQSGTFSELLTSLGGDAAQIATAYYGGGSGGGSGGNPAPAQAPAPAQVGASGGSSRTTLIVAGVFALLIGGAIVYHVSKGKK